MAIFVTIRRRPCPNVLALTSRCLSGVHRTQWQRTGVFEHADISLEHHLGDGSEHRLVFRNQSALATLIAARRLCAPHRSVVMAAAARFGRQSSSGSACARIVNTRAGPRRIRHLESLKAVPRSIPSNRALSLALQPLKTNRRLRLATSPTRCRYSWPSCPI